MVQTILHNIFHLTKVLLLLNSNNDNNDNDNEDENNNNNNEAHNDYNIDVCNNTSESPWV